IPFLVQAPGRRDWKRLFRRQWSTLLIGPDVGSIIQPVTLGPGERYEFPFRLQGTRLDYGFCFTTGQAKKTRAALFNLVARARRSPANSRFEVQRREFFARKNLRDPHSCREDTTTERRN